MKQFSISKTFELCYGHRVHNQTLNGEFSDNLKCACRHFHGHQGTVIVHLQSDTLTNGMVTDLRHTEWLKRFIDEYIDHQFVIDINDPLYPKHVGTDKVLVPVYIPGHNVVAGRNIDLSVIDPLDPEYEFLEGIFVVDFVPTSENLSKWIAEIVDIKMSSLNVSVSHVEWYETPKSRAIYYSPTITEI